MARSIGLIGFRPGNTIVVVVVQLHVALWATTWGSLFKLRQKSLDTINDGGGGGTT